MDKVVLQINYKITNSFAEHHKMLALAAEPIAAMPGLIWKLWVHNDAEHTVGGVVMFENMEAAQGYLNSPIAKGFAHPTIQNLSVVISEPIEELSEITRAPITWGHMV